MLFFDILLILPRQDIEPFLHNESSETGWWQQIGHGILATEAMAHGLSCKILDENTFDSHIDFINFLENEIRAKVVGISPSITNVKTTIDILNTVKKSYLEVKTILGGQMVSQPTAGNKFLTHYSNLIDAICIGDGRGVFSYEIKTLFNHIEYGYENLIPVKNYNEKWKHSWSNILNESFNKDISIGHPIDYSLCYDLEKYWRKFNLNYISKNKSSKYFKPVSLQTMHGCPNRNEYKSCLFCDRIEKNLRYNQIDIVLKELNSIVETGGDAVSIVDDNGILSNKLISSDIVANWPKQLGIVFMYSSINDLTISNVEKLKALNCEKVFIGIESGEDECIKSYGKHFTRAKVIDTVKLLHDYDIKVSPSFVLGAPPMGSFAGETIYTLSNTLNLAETLVKMENVDLAFSNILIPCEGSRAYEILKDKIPAHIKTYIESDLFIKNEYIQELWCEYVLNISYKEILSYQNKMEKLFSNFIFMYRN